MPDFIAAAGSSLFLLVGLLIAGRILSAFIEKTRLAKIDRNTRDLADIRAQLGLEPFQDTRIGA